LDVESYCCELPNCGFLNWFMVNGAYVLRISNGVEAFLSYE